MNNNLSYDEIINRIAIFRNKRNLSARELSLRMGFSPTYFYKVENKSIILNVPTLLLALETLEVSTFEFFYQDIETFDKDTKMLDLYRSLEKDNKERIVDLMKNLKWKR